MLVMGSVMMLDMESVKVSGHEVIHRFGHGVGHDVRLTLSVMRS